MVRIPQLTWLLILVFNLLVSSRVCFSIFSISSFRFCIRLSISPIFSFSLMCIGVSKIFRSPPLLNDEVLLLLKLVVILPLVSLFFLSLSLEFCTYCIYQNYFTKGMRKKTKLKSDPSSRTIFIKFINQHCLTNNN